MLWKRMVAEFLFFVRNPERIPILKGFCLICHILCDTLLTELMYENIDLTAFFRFYV
ncbi:hypothetical protein QY97_02352 [Bacillus thermotolerans]|nr:hypothetical protein QY96_03555 [Bacillus thermotolerans]KKB38443.1 hypothetical protein QY97_02352 [Bacillus thermotolerans]